MRASAAREWALFVASTLLLLGGAACWFLWGPTPASVLWTGTH